MATAREIVDQHEGRILRHVELEGTGYRLLTWDTGRAHRGGPQWGVGYAFFAPEIAEPLFTGEDYGCSPCHAIDSDDSLRALLGFLTLKPGDTDIEYFDGYTAAQMDFATGEAEHLSMWSIDEREMASDEVYGFVDVTCDAFGAISREDA